MTTDVRSGVPWRAIGWGSAVIVLAAPFVAMQFGNQVNWTAGDFLFAGALFAFLGGCLELAARTSRDRFYRGGIALALLATLLAVWTNLAVGIVGSENNPANLLFFAALLSGAVGSFVARFRAAGMSIAMIATATLLWGAFALAVSLPTDEPHVSHLLELAGTSVFAALFIGSAVLFHKAAES